jgi:hypothetical protein
MVDRKDRDDYEEGVRDAHGTFGQRLVWDISGNHPDSDAYYKGRRGEQLDDDKKDKSKD